MADSEKREFPNPFDFNSFEPVTLVELRMRILSGAIRAKPLWWEKVNDPEIVAKWRAEIVEQDRAAVERFWGGAERLQDTLHTDEDGWVPKQWPRDPINDAQLDYIFEELKWAASRRDEATGIFETAIHRVYESRSLIPSELTEQLNSAVTILEDVPEDQKDWHPGTNKQVLDLVHPSLYCLRIGETLVRDGDKLKVIDVADYLDRTDLKEDYNGYAISEDYQWLPTDFVVSDKGDVKAVNYINNLHPRRHRALYPPITSVLARFTPLFEKVLADTLAPERPLVVDANPFGWYESLTEGKPKWEDYQPDRENEYYRVCEEWEHMNQWPVIPDPDPFDADDIPDVPPYPLKGRTLQVIVKLANIVLTPDNPAYPGGSWHVEGMANERIVATGLYYYACENITESRLAFRKAVGPGENGMELSYEQGDSRGWRVAYGFGREDFMSQPLGHVCAEEGKCVSFPNVYQHRVEPFQLADPTKPGVRKILCFFLVNPETRILSTTDVPPQQQDWALDEAERVPQLQKLPLELFDMIVDRAKEGMMTRAQAEEHRAKLMEERSNFVVQHNEEVFEMDFNLCEH